MTESAFVPATEADRIRSRLERLAARPAWGKEKIFLRIAVPNLRQVLREREAVLAAATDGQLAEFAESLWNGVTYDEMHVAIEVLRLRPSLVSEPLIDHFRPGLDNRAVADDLASVVRAWVADDRDARYPVLERWAAEPYAWTRWLALAGTVLLSRRGDEAERTLALIETVIDDRRPPVMGGMSLALRELIKSHPDLVATFIEERADDLPARVRLEARNKLRFGRADGKPARKEKRPSTRQKRSESRRSAGDQKTPRRRR